jgi:hypothetical protein
MYEGPGRYRHYKGNLYDVVGIGIHESELYRAVIYKPVKAAQLDGEQVEFWLRPLSDFNETINKVGEHSSTAARVERFTKVHS